jgi:chromosome segregation ATPase
VREVYARLLDVASDQTSIDDRVLRAEIHQWLQELERFSTSLKLADKQLERRQREIESLKDKLASYQLHWIFHVFPHPNLKGK